MSCLYVGIRARSVSRRNGYISCLLWLIVLAWPAQWQPILNYFVDAAGNGNGAYYNDDGESYHNEYNDDISQGGSTNDDGDDTFRVEGDMSFDGVSVMPVSCINYNNGHMIKFELFENDSGYQCRFRNIGSFVVSISHYMRAYFNYQALEYGRDFQLPGDAEYLGCVLLQETAYAETKLYAKIGCMDRETFTSTKLQLHVYTDAQCSVPYDDGESSRHHSTKGYKIDGYYFSTKVSFRPPFYACQTCAPEEISANFNKKSGNWYDDDYISQNGQKMDDDDGGGGEKDDAFDDDYDNGGAAYADDNQDGNHDYGGNDDYYARRRRLRYDPQTQGQLPHENMVDKDSSVDRLLYDNYYDVGDWNMCQKISKYGVWCDEECRSLDTFRVDEWSKPDVLLLMVMCAFMASMMMLVLAKRLKATQKARVYGDGDNYKPGLPPLAMFFVFVVILGVVAVLARMKFVNETLVFAVVTCILLFIYMLKLTLFENRRPVLLAAPRHDMFDNPLDDRLFD